jgi:hypothetical protein
MAPTVATAEPKARLKDLADARQYDWGSPRIEWEYQRVAPNEAFHAKTVDWERGYMTRFRPGIGYLKLWWPIPFFLVIAAMGKLLLTQGYDAKGHAADHLSSANAIFPMLAVFAVIVWSSSGARRRPEIWALGGLLGITLSMVLIGNLEVVNAIGGQTWTDAQADSLGPGRVGFASGHTLSEVGMWSTVAVTLMIAIVLLRRHLLTRRQAITASIVSIIFPPFLIPGAGLIVVAVALCWTRGAQLGGPPAVGATKR